MSGDTWINSKLLGIIVTLPDDEMRTILAYLRLTNGSQQIGGIAIEDVSKLSGLNYTITARAMSRLIVKRLLWS